MYNFISLMKRQNRDCNEKVIYFGISCRFARRFNVAGDTQLNTISKILHQSLTQSINQSISTKLKSCTDL